MKFKVIFETGGKKSFKYVNAKNRDIAMKKIKSKFNTSETHFNFKVKEVGR